MIYYVTMLQNIVHWMVKYAVLNKVMDHFMRHPVLERISKFQPKGVYVIMNWNMSYGSTKDAHNC
jgi:hypothetical protein